MMICFITDTRSGEPEILPQLVHDTLTIRDLAGAIIGCKSAPDGGWTHDRLVAEAEAHAHITVEGANAYLGEQWVGSTEV